MLVKNALDAMLKKAFRGTIKADSGNMAFEFVPPDNYHITLDAGEYIIFGSREAYMKTDGKWSKTDAGPAGFLVLPLAMGAGFSDKVTNAKLLPNETLSGASMQVVSYTGQFDMGGPGDPGIQYKMWIGSDGLPRQVTFKKSDAAGTTTIQYDSSIKIVAPPVQ